jgi:HAD superfamily hydrolase (TIGR01459 family)
MRRVFVTESSSLPALLDGFSAISGRYDVVLCDIWGVLHNGIDAYASASETLTRYRKAGGTVILVSNAPRPAPDVVGLLDKIGVARSAYDGVVTSGDVARALLSEGKWQSYFWLGPKRDGGLFKGLSLTEAALDQSDVIVCTGLYDDTTETPEDYRPFIDKALALGLPFLCANPDILVERGGTLIYCAGAIAGLYEAQGGETLYSGKPYRPIYDAALKVAASITKRDPDLSRILMIGDAIRTDVAGASALGCDSLFVLRGIHMHELGLETGALEDGTFARFIENAAFRPTYAIDRLGG